MEMQGMWSQGAGKIILIRVTGDTYKIRKRLLVNRFRWNPHKKEWWRRMAEGSINSTIEALRPMRSYNDHSYPNITVILTSVDINGKTMRDGEMGIKLEPQGESEGVDILDLFHSKVITLSSPSPSNSEYDAEECEGDCYEVLGEYCNECQKRIDDMIEAEIEAKAIEKAEKDGLI